MSSLYHLAGMLLKSDSAGRLSEEKVNSNRYGLIYLASQNRRLGFFLSYHIFLNLVVGVNV